MARNTKNFVVAKKNNLKNSSKLYSISNINFRRHKIDSGGKNKNAAENNESAITSVNIKENIMKNRIVTNKKSNCLVLMSVQLILLLVLLNYFVDIVDSHEVRRSRQHKAMQFDERDGRKMFGGYRITPKFCTPSRPSRKYRTNSLNEKKGPAICMFNHECLQRQGDVVGSCMDGFLFGACCQLYGTPGIIRDTVEDGVVISQNDNFMNTDMMTPDKIFNVKDQDLRISVPQIINSLMDNSNIMKTTDKYEAATLKEGSTTVLVDSNVNVEVGNHFVKHPSTLSVSMNAISSSTQKYPDLTSHGVAQITNSLLQHAPNDADIVNLGKLPDTGLFSLSTISHEEPDTYLVDNNGSILVDYAKPSDFSAPASNIQISTMQTKPAMSSHKPESVTPKPAITSTFSLQSQKPVYHKPVFRPKPTKAPNNQDKFVLVQTVTKPESLETSATSSLTSSSSLSELASIESIITMLNGSRPSSVPINSQTTPISDDESTQNTYTTALPQSYSSGIPQVVSNSVYISSVSSPTGHYVTTAVHKYTTPKPPSTSYVKKPSGTKRPSTTNLITSSGFFTRKPVVTQTATYQISNSNDKEPIGTSTLSYDEYWASPSDSYTSPFPARKPPSTSYVYGPTPTRRPISNIPNGPSNFDAGSNLDTFSSVTPTVILLDSLSSHYDSYTPKPTKLPTKNDFSNNSDDNYVEIPLKPPSSSSTNNNNKKPIHQVTINNIISSTNMIHLGALNPAIQTISSTERPSPTILITPKPTTITPPTNDLFYTKPDKYHNDYISTISSDDISTFAEASSATTTAQPTVTRLPPYYTVPNVRPSFYDQATGTNQPIMSQDDLINFPPVRNPNLDFSASNHNIFNNTISLSAEDVLPDVEFTTPALVAEDDDLNDKMSLFVNKIVGSFQGTFQELHDIVILDKSPSVNLTQPTRRPTTRRPSTSTKKPVRVVTTTSATTTKKTPSKKPVKPTTKRPVATTTSTEATTIVSTRKPSKASTTLKPKPKPTKSKTTVAPTTTTLQEVDVGEEESYTTETPTGDFKHLCGVRPLVKTGRIVGGKDASFGEWPWQVLVRESTWLGLFTKNKCGGVLITNSYVTTAAHCQPGFLASLVAVMGEFDISGDLESKRSVTKNVRRVIVHRNYDAATFENDLALLELESPVTFDVHIVPICMPPDEADFTGRFATVTGWGRQKYGGGVPSILQEVRVPVIENSMCQEMFHTAGHSKVILNSFLCAGYANGQKDSCEGDSGGPLVLQRPDGRWELVGTVSHGIKCAAPYLPGVYMRTTFYKPWLKSITGVQ